MTQADREGSGGEKERGERADMSNFEWKGKPMRASGERSPGGEMGGTQI